MRAYAPLLGAIIGAALVGSLIATAYFFGADAFIAVMLCLLGALAGGAVGAGVLE